MSLVVGICLRMDIATIKIAETLVSDYGGINTWLVSELLIFLNFIRTILSQLAEFILVGLIFTTDSGFSETSLELVINFSALLILVNIDNMVVGYFQRMVPEKLLSDSFNEEANKKFTEDFLKY